jgi:hypothetical protein
LQDQAGKIFSPSVRNLTFLLPINGAYHVTICNNVKILFRWGGIYIADTKQADNSNAYMGSNVFGHDQDVQD